MTSCVFRYCKNTSRNVSESSGISFHRFVHSGHPRREEWTKIVQNDRSDNTWLPTKYSFICSAHFQADDFYLTKAGKRFLRKSAIPRSNHLEDDDQYPHASPTSLDNMQISDSESIFDTPKKIKLKKDLRKISAAKKLLSKKIIKLQRQNKHLNQKTKNLTAFVKQLKNKFGISKQIQNKLLKKAEVVVEMFSNTLNKIRKSRKKIKYSPSIRKFSLTCNYYSPAAYKYIRQFFQNALPHPRTLTKWYGCVNAEPGTDLFTYF